MPIFRAARLLFGAIEVASGAPWPCGGHTGGRRPLKVQALHRAQMTRPTCVGGRGIFRLAEFSSNHDNAGRPITMGLEVGRELRASRCPSNEADLAGVVVSVQRSHPCPSPLTPLYYLPPPCTVPAPLYIRHNVTTHEYSPPRRALHVHPD